MFVKLQRRRRPAVDARGGA